MGGHGAWTVGTHHPSSFSCVAALASWINKEEYGQANAFFALDVQNPGTSVCMRALLGNACSPSTL